MKEHLLAQVLKIQPPGNPAGNFQLKGPLDPSITDLGSLINRLLLFGVPLAFLVLFFVFVSAGYDLLRSGGAPDKIKSAKAKFTYGIIGLVLILLAYFITALVGQIFGFGKGFFF